MLLLLLPVTLSAQSNFSLQLGGIGGFSKSASFNSFRETYNELNATSFKKEMKKPSLSFGYGLQLDYTMGNMYVAVGHSSINAKAEAVFTNEAERHLDFKQQYYHTLIGYIRKNETSEWAVYSGFSVSQLFMTSYIRFSSGDKDYTTGILNGTYQAVGFTVPLFAHYGIELFPDFWLYAKAQLQMISATKFSLYSNTTVGSFSSSGAVYFDKEIFDDAKRILFEIGVKRNLHL